MLGSNSPERSQQRPVSQLALPGSKNAFETSLKKSPGKEITKDMPVLFPPSSSANSCVEAEGEWGPGVNGDENPGGRRGKGKEKTLEPIEDDEVPMVVSPIKPQFPEPTHARQSAIPRPGVVQLKVEGSPLASRFGGTGGPRLVDLDGREDSGESDGDEFVSLSLVGEVAFTL